MTTAKVLKWLGTAIIIILLVVDTFFHEISFPLLIAGLWVGAIIDIVGIHISRRNKK